MRKSRTTTLNDDLYKAINILKNFLDKDANDLIEEGMEDVLEKYKDKVDDLTRQQLEKALKEYRSA